MEPVGVLHVFACVCVGVVALQEPDYFGGGQYRMDAGGSPTMLNSMMYKMCYYRCERRGL